MSVVTIGADSAGTLWIAGGARRLPLPESPDAAMQVVAEALLEAHRTPGPTTHGPADGPDDVVSLARFQYATNAGWLLDLLAPRRPVPESAPARLATVLDHESSVRALVVRRELDFAHAIFAGWTTLDWTRLRNALASTPLYALGLPLDEACPALALVLCRVPATRARLYAAAGYTADEVTTLEEAGAFDADRLRVLAALRQPDPY
ncbi:hypothetical protein [Geodermatophilus sp. SYSU D01176]